MVKSCLKRRLAEPWMYEMLPAMGAALAMLLALPALAVRERRMCTPSLCVGGDDGAFDASLIASARVVHRFAPTDPARYLSVLNVGGGGAWLAARRGSFPSADGANISAVVWTGCDAQLRSPAGGACAAAAPVELFRGDAVAHNVDFLLAGGALYAFGGLFDDRHGAGRRIRQGRPQRHLGLPRPVGPRPRAPRRGAARGARAHHPRPRRVG